MKQLLIDTLLECGYEPDPRGNLVCTATQTMRDGRVVKRKYRVKFQEISVRFEVQGLDRHPVYNTLPWLRITSCYYSQIVDFKDGRVRLGSVILGARCELQAAA
jgi:hypothetical protein